MPNPDAIPRTPDPGAEPGWKLRLEDRLGLLDAIQLLVFRSFGTPRRLHVRGRVLEQTGVKGSTEESSIWRNVADMLRRLDSDEIPGARIRARFGQVTVETTSDNEGYFVVDLEPAAPLEPGWHEVELELVDSVGQPARRVVRERVLVPRSDAAFGLISDVDDTIIRSRSNDLLDEVRIVLSQGARDRVAIPGIPALYRALTGGPDGAAENPVFYVSRSGWNLYDLFTEFMRVNEIPAGPLFLSDLRLLGEHSQVMGSTRHKWDSIDLLMRTYPELRFVLVGDSGMHDPELYREVVERHPGRVVAVYVHDVSDDGRDGEVERIARALEEHGVPMLRMQNATAAAEHACALGLIGRDAVEEVRREAERQEERADR